VSPRASKKNQLRVIKEVPAPQRQERIFDDLVRRGVRIVVPALQAKQQRARERGGGSKNTVGPWLGLRWAVKEVQKRWGFLPSEELIEAMRLKYVEKPDEDLSAQ
jgi:hypothetical protein